MFFSDISKNEHFVASDETVKKDGFVRYTVNHKVVKADEYVVFDGSAVEAIVRYNNDEHAHIRFTSIGDVGRRVDELVPIREDIELMLANVESIEVKYNTFKEI